MSFWKDKTAILITTLGLIVRGIASMLVPLGVDEAYYGVFSMNLAAGYYDHPPLVAFTAGFGRWLTGSWSPLSLRLGALLIFVLSVWMIYLITEKLFNRKAAVISVAFIHVIPYFLVGMGAFVIPDNALSFFTHLFIYSLVMVQESKNPRWFLLSGCALGLSLLSKYHGILLLGGIGVSLLFFPEWRRWFKSPFLYLGLVICLIIFLPNILWN